MGGGHVESREGFQEEAILHPSLERWGMAPWRGQNRLLGASRVPRTGHWTAARSWTQACGMGTGAEARAETACSWVGKTMDAVLRQGGGCLGNAGRQQSWKGSLGVVGRGVEDDGAGQQLQGHPPGILGGRGDGCGHSRGKSPWKPPKVRPNMAPRPGSPASLI